MSRRKKRADKKNTNKRRRKNSFIFKIINSFIAVVAISALILFVVVFIGRISEFDNKTFNNVLSKLFTNFRSDVVLDEGDLINYGPDDNLLPFDVSNNELIFKICIFSDIHEDVENLNKAFKKASGIGCEKLFILGDLTNYGDTDSLKLIREVFDTFGVEYYAIPGDHDIADSLSTENFNMVFGVNYHMLEYKGVGFLLIDNSANFTEIGSIQMSWGDKNIGSVDFVVLSQPLFTEGSNPPFNSTYMGSMLNSPEDDEMREKQGYVRKQGELLLDMIRKNKNIRAIIAGDHHRSSKIDDSVRSDLTHYVVGAITSTFNDYPQAAVQTSRFSVLSLYEEKKYVIEDVLVD
jgi:hypothetical protein